jgi:membrane protein implicated in regulation of membrane protease activity
MESRLASENIGIRRILASAVAIHGLALWVLGVGHPDVAMVTATTVSVVAYWSVRARLAARELLSQG